MDLNLESIGLQNRAPDVNTTLRLVTFPFSPGHQRSFHEVASCRINPTELLGKVSCAPTLVLGAKRRSGIPMPAADASGCVSYGVLYHELL